jgi:Lysyl oxidase
MGDPSIHSTRRSRRRTALIVSLLLAPLVAIPARADDGLDSFLGDPGITLPNLVPNVEMVHVFDYRTFGDGTFTEPGQFLWFDTRAQNLGTVPMQLTVDEVDTPESSTVSQCVSWRSAEAHLCRQAEAAGGFTWHEEHRHFHYQDFATYELRRLGADGWGDYSDTGLLAVSAKVSFCLMDSDAVEDDNPMPSFYQTCTPTVQGISPRFTDIYTSGLEGQNMSIAGVPNGDYVLTTHVNYGRTLRETEYEDNFVEVKIRISDADDPNTYPAGRKAEILEKRWPTSAERTTTATTTSTTTTTIVVGRSRTLPSAPQVRDLEPALPTFKPLSRRNSTPPRSPQCPQSCTRTWARPNSSPDR